jgi:Fe2+ or Zn2+ uptake regulation protein
MAASTSASGLDDELRQTVTQRLRRAKQRFTSQRELLVTVLSGAGRPLTIPEIGDAAPAMATSSVYRNLVVLEQAGVVRRFAVHDEFVRYELAEDLTEHHHHLICAQCGAVEDVPASAGLEQSVERAAADIAKRTGFRTQHHRVDLVGICRRCA